MSELYECFSGRGYDDVHELVVPEHYGWNHLLGGEPATKAMTGGVDAKELVEPAIERLMLAILQALEVLTHVLGFPGRIPGEPSDVVPIGVVGIDEDHGIVGGTASQGAGAGIENAIMLGAEVHITVLLLVIGVVPHEEIPLHRRILGRKGMKDGDVVVVRQAAISQLHRVAPCFQEQHFMSCLSQVRRYWPATSA
jgi:hypothetical protein